MLIHFDSTSRPTLAQASIEASPQVPLGRGNGTSTLESMASPEASKYRVSNTPFSLWKRLRLMSFFSHTAEMQNIQESDQRTIERKIEKIFQDHFSTDYLDLMDQPEWKVGVVIHLEDQLFIQCRHLNRQSAIPFRNEIIRQVEETGWVKNKIETLTLDSNLMIETYFMKRVDRKNIFIYPITCAGAISGPIDNLELGETGPLTRDETAKFLDSIESTQYFVGFKNFFLNP